MTYKEEIVGVGRDSMWIPAPVRDKFRRNDKSNKTLYFRYADFSARSTSPSTSSGFAQGYKFKFSRTSCKGSSA